MGRGGLRLDRGAAGRCPSTSSFLIEGEEEIGSTQPAGLPEALPRSSSTPTSWCSPTPTTSRPACRRSPGSCAAIVQVDVEVTCLEPPRPQRRLRRRRARTRSGSCAACSTTCARRTGASPCRASTATWRARAPRCGGACARLPFSEAAFRRGAGMLPGTRLERERGVSVYEQVWTRPSLTVIAIEAHPLHGAANQILDSARARISMRTVPNMDSEEAGGAARPQAHRAAPGRRPRRGPDHALHPVVDDRARRARPSRRRCGRSEKGYGTEAGAHRLRRVDRFRQALRRRDGRALPAHRRRGPRLRRALREREPAPRRLAKVDALGRAPVRRAGRARHRRAEAHGAEAPARQRRRVLLPAAVGLRRHTAPWSLS